MSAPSNSYNWAGLGLKDPNDTNKSPVKPQVFIKYSKHDSNIKETTSEDSANIGGSTTTIGFDRTQLVASPEITDKLRFKEGLEIDCYVALGGDRIGTAEKTATGKKTTDGTTADETIQRYVFNWSPRANRETLPLLTETKGFNMWTTESATGANDALRPKIIDNMKLDEMEIKLEAKGNLTIKPKFAGDAPIFNVADGDMSKTFLPKSRNVKQANVSIYYGSPNTTAVDVDTLKEELVSSSCVKDITIKLNNNLTSAECFNEEFGKNSQDEGNFEATVSGTFELNRATAREEAAWVTGDKLGVWATTDTYIRQILVAIEGIPILDSDGNEVKTTDGDIFDYKLFMRFPRLAIDKWELSEDGDDTATVDFEGKTILEVGATDGNVQNAPCIFTCYTDLPRLDYPSERSTTATDVYYTVPAK